MADAATVCIIVKDGHQATISAAAWSPDSRFIVTGSFGGQLILWNTNSLVIDRAKIDSPRGVNLAYVERIKVSLDGLSATAVQPFYDSDSTHVHAVQVTWRFGEANTSAGLEVPPRARLVKYLRRWQGGDQSPSDPAPRDFPEWASSGEQW